MVRLARFERATYPLKGECSTCWATDANLFSFHCLISAGRACAIFFVSASFTVCWATDANLFSFHQPFLTAYLIYQEHFFTSNTFLQFFNISLMANSHKDILLMSLIWYCFFVKLKGIKWKKSYFYLLF